MKRSLIYRTLIAVLGTASIQPLTFAESITDFDNDPYAASIVEVDQHEELHLKTQLSGYDYDVELDTDITKALHLYFAYNDSGNGKVEGNTLTWTQGNIGSASAATDVYVFAAYSADTDVNNNTLNIVGGAFYPQKLSGNTEEGAGKIAAAKSDSASMYGNKVVVSGGYFNTYMEIIGAYSNDQSETGQVASGNSVEVNGSNTAPQFHSNGSVAPSLYGAKLHTADVHNNRVTVSSLNNDSNFSNIVGGHAASGSISGNGVEITGSAFKAENIYGGRIVFDGEDFSEGHSYNATDNDVHIQNSEIGFSVIAASGNEAGNSNNGTVYIADTTLKPVSPDAYTPAYITGGYSWNSSASTSGNTVHLVDVTVEGNSPLFVYAAGEGWAAGDIRDNTIILESKNYADQEEKLSSVTFYGYEMLWGEARNNSFVVRKWNGKIGGIARFDSITFDDFKWVNNGTILDVQGEANISSTTLNINTTNIRFEDGELENHFGEQMTLIQGSQNHAISFNPIYDNGQQIAIPSTITEDSIGVIQNNRKDNSVEFKLQGTAPSQQLELVSNNRNMSLFFVNHGAELILDNLDATSRDYHWGIRTFASIDGVQSNYSTDGHIDVHGFTAAAGWANSVMVDGNPLLLNLFVETGMGDYTEEMSYLNIDRRFSGNVKYYGAGISTRIKNQAGWYAEGSLRAGRTETEVSRGLVDGNGIAHGYELSGHYFGAHIGAGRIIDVGEQMKADLFMKYFYTYLPSDSTDIFADEIKNQFDFDSVDSSRVRVGARLYFPLQKAFWAYTGLAYQYDFSPEVHVDVNGEKITGGATMRGSMGIGSLGLRYKSEDSPWVLDLKVRGYVGQREGISGKAQVEYRY